MSRFFLLPQRLTIRRYHPLVDEVTIDGLDLISGTNLVPSIEKFFERISVTISMNQKLYDVSFTIPAARSIGHG